MSIQYKKFIYNGLVGSVIASYLFFKVATVHAASLDPLLPVTMCGEMDLPGIYVIAEDFNVPAANCFTVQSDDVTIRGTTTTPTITGSSGFNFVTIATDVLTGNTYGTTTIENLNVEGFTFLVDATGQTDQGTGYGGSVSPIIINSVTSSGYIRTQGGYSGTGTAGNGGNIFLTDSTSGSIFANGGNSSAGIAGNGGTISLTNSISGDIRAYGGSSPYGNAGNGGYVSVYNSIYGTINVSGGYGGYGYGNYGTINYIPNYLDPGVISTCGILNDPDEIYIIEDGANLIKDNCLVVEANNITIVGSTTNPTIQASNKANFITVSTDAYSNAFGTTTIENLTVYGFSNFVYANGQYYIGPGPAGNGGNISIIDVTTYGNIYAYGGGTYYGTAGNGGTISLLNNSSVGSIYASGGATRGYSYYGNGGNGGTVSLTDSTTRRIVVPGGNSSYAYNSISKDGGNGGTVTLTNSSIYEDLIASGGNSAGGSAGMGGTVIFTNSDSLGVSVAGGVGNQHAGPGGNVTLTDNSNVENIFAGGGAYSELGAHGGVVSLVDSTAFNIYVQGSGGFQASDTDGGTVTLENSISGNIYASGGNYLSSSGYAYAGNGGDITLENSTSGNIRASGGYDSYGTAGNGGTISLLNNSSVGNIYAPGGWGGYGSGTAGNGGTISLDSSTSGYIYAYGGMSTQNSGNGGTIEISGTNMTMFAQNPALNVSSLHNNNGTITVDGSILFDTNESWTSDASSWLGTATWSFLSNSENQGTVKGDADFRDTSINQTGADVIGTCQLFDDSINLGTCDDVVYKYGYFFKNVGGNDEWENVDNWFVDKDATIPLGFAPTSTNETIYIAGTTTGPTASTTVGTIKVADDKTGGGIFGINISNVFGLNPSTFSVSFFNGGFNTGIINGIMKLFSSTLGGFSSINQGGSVTGDVEFYNDSYNDTDNVSSGAFSGIAKFFDTSYNAITGALGIAEFNETSENQGSVETGTFNDSSVNTATGDVSDATFNDTTVNLGTFTTALFNGTSYNDGFVTGDVAFNSGTKNTGTIEGDPTFNTGSRNEGTILGDSRFEGTAYNIGTSTNATFVGEYSENFNGVNEGIVTGIKTRLYNAANAQYNLLRNFAESAWTIVADNTFVKLLYRSLIDLVSGSPTETTLVEQNGGVILAPTLGTAVTGCAVLDTADTTYVLQNNITNFKYDTCFIITADNITLDGNNKTIDALNSADTTAIITASTTATTTGASAYTNFTLKNATLTDFDIAIDARGQNNTNGNGGQGGTLALESVILKADILADGGDGTTNGGHAGDVSLLDTTTKGINASSTISMDGGSSTSCGSGGDAGFLDAINSEFDLVSAEAGSAEISGCVTPEEEESASSGSSGGTRTNTGTYTPPGSGGNTGGNTGGGNTGGGSSTGGTLRNLIKNIVKPLDFTPLTPFSPFTPNFNPATIGDTLIPDPFQNFQPPGLINLIRLPINFLTNISKFLFAPLPDNFTQALLSSPQLGSYLASVGVSKEQDMAMLQANPIPLDAPLSDQSTPPGLFIIRSGESTLTSYATYDASLGRLVQLVKTAPTQSLTISLIPQSEGDVTALYLGQSITFTTGSLFASTQIQTPPQGGRYILKSTSSPIPLLIEVIAPIQPEPAKKPWGIFHFIWKLLFN